MTDAPTDKKLSKFQHASDCAVHDGPGVFAWAACNCGARALTLIESLRDDVPTTALGDSPALDATQ